VRVAVLLSSQVSEALEIVTAWARAGDAVTVVLLDAAVAVTRPGHREEGWLTDALDAGVLVLAHDEALRSRALAAEARADEVKAVELDEIADLVTTGADKAVWW
jgi:hypothetical protein